MNVIAPAHLRTLRNDVPIEEVVVALGIDTGRRGKRPTVRCPQCRHFHTAKTPRANLVRCFRCQRNFNPIDLVMAQRDASFREAVSYVEGLHHQTRRVAEERTSLRSGGNHGFLG